MISGPMPAASPIVIPIVGLFAVRGVLVRCATVPDWIWPSVRIIFFIYLAVNQPRLERNIP